MKKIYFPALTALVAIAAITSFATLWGRAAPPQAPPAAADTSLTSHAALFQVLRAIPTDSDEAWQRQIATFVGWVQFRRSLYESLAASDEVKPLVSKFTPNTDLQRATIISPIAGTSLVAIWVKCSDDVDTCIEVTNALASLILREQSAQHDAWLKERLTAQTQVLEKLHDNEKISNDALQVYIAARGGDDHPLKPAEQRAIDYRQAEVRTMLDLRIEAARRMIDTQMEQDPLPKLLEPAH